MVTLSDTQQQNINKKIQEINRLAGEVEQEQDTQLQNLSSVGDVPQTDKDGDATDTGGGVTRYTREEQQEMGFDTPEGFSNYLTEQENQADSDITASGKVMNGKAKGDAQRGASNALAGGVGMQDSMQWIKDQQQQATQQAQQAYESTTEAAKLNFDTQLAQANQKYSEALEDLEREHQKAQQTATQTALSLNPYATGTQSFTAENYKNELRETYQEKEEDIRRNAELMEQALAAGQAEVYAQAQANMNQAIQDANRQAYESLRRLESEARSMAQWQFNQQQEEDEDQQQVRSAIAEVARSAAEGGAPQNVIDKIAESENETQAIATAQPYIDKTETTTTGGGGTGTAGDGGGGVTGPGLIIRGGGPIDMTTINQAGYTMQDLEDADVTQSDIQKFNRWIEGDYSINEIFEQNPSLTTSQKRILAKSAGASISGEVTEDRFSPNDMRELRRAGLEQSESGAQNTFIDSPSSFRGWFIRNRPQNKKFFTEQEMQGYYGQWQQEANQDANQDAGGDNEDWTDIE